MEEIDIMLAWIATQRNPIATQSQQQVSGYGTWILGNSLGFCNMSHYTKLEFLAFNGDGLTEWLHKVKQLFKIDNTIDAIKVKLASIHFEGQTLH